MVGAVVFIKKTNISPLRSCGTNGRVAMVGGEMENGRGLYDVDDNSSRLDC